MQYNKFLFRTLKERAERLYASKGLRAGDLGREALAKKTDEAKEKARVSMLAKLEGCIKWLVLCETFSAHGAGCYSLGFFSAKKVNYRNIYWFPTVSAELLSRGLRELRAILGEWHMFCIP